MSLGQRFKRKKKRLNGINHIGKSVSEADHFAEILWRTSMYKWSVVDNTSIKKV